MSADLKPWHDTPVCNQNTCTGPLIPKRSADWNHRATAVDRLVCCSCGLGCVGSDAEVEQAERAQVAWDAEEKRQRGMSSCAELCWAEECRKAGECDG